MSVLAAIDVDQSPAGPIRVGYDLATAYDDTLLVLYVITDEEFERQREAQEDLPKEFHGGFSLEQVSERAANQADRAVRDVLGEYDHSRISVRGQVGDVAGVIVSLAERLEPSFVIVGGRRRSVAEQALFGSVSQSVLRRVERPVITVMEPKKQRSDR